MSSVRQFASDLEIPQADSSETAILGAILLDPALVWDVAGWLHEADFRSERHRLTFATMKKLAERGTPLDPITILAELAGSADRIAPEITGSWVSALIDGMPRVANVDAYCAKVREAATARRLQLASSSLMGLATDGLTTDELRERTQLAIDRAFGPPSSDGMAAFTEWLEEGVRRIEATREARDGWGTCGIATGLPTLDRVLGGLQAKLYVAAGRPGVGKSSLMSLLAMNAVLQDRRVLVFSSEMQGSEVALRFVALQAGIDSTAINSARFEPDEWERLDGAREWARKIGDRLLIDHTSGPTPTQIRARCKQLQRTGGLDLVAIDYLQLLRLEGRATTETERVSRLSNEIKQLQQALGIPVLLLSQLSRNSTAEKREPQLHDLRQSGSIEQDADVVMLLHAPDANEAEPETDGPVRIKLLIRKHRAGKCGSVDLWFDGRRFEFYEGQHDA